MADTVLVSNSTGVQDLAEMSRVSQATQDQENTTMQMPSGDDGASLDAGVPHDDYTLVSQIGLMGLITSSSTGSVASTSKFFDIMDTSYTDMRKGGKHRNKASQYMAFPGTTNDTKTKRSGTGTAFVGHVTRKEQRIAQKFVKAPTSLSLAQKDNIATNVTLSSQSLSQTSGATVPNAQIGSTNLKTLMSAIHKKRNDGYDAEIVPDADVVPETAIRSDLNGGKNTNLQYALANNQLAPKPPSFAYYDEEEKRH